MGQKTHLLIVEDQAIIQEVHCTFLHWLDCQVTLANSAEEVQGLLFPRLPSVLLYNLILLDLGLPDLNGIELCQWIRRFYEPESLPIVAVTSSGLEKEEACMEAGMQWLFTKPLSLNTYSSIIERFARR